METQDQLWRISEVSERLMVPTHTLRFWEKELEGFILPQRSAGGQRRYSSSEVAILELVKKLRKKGMSLPRIAKIIGENGGKKMIPTGKIDLLAHRVAEAVKAQVYDFFQKDGGEE